MLRFLPVCISLVLALPGVGRAAPTIAVVGIHQSSLEQPDQQRAVEALVKAIEASGRFDALDPGEVGAALTGRETVVLDEGLLALPNEKLSTGKNSYNQASWDDAIVSLQDAIDGYGGVFRATNKA